LSLYFFTHDLLGNKQKQIKIQDISSVYIHTSFGQKEREKKNSIHWALLYALFNTVARHKM